MRNNKWFALGMALLAVAVVLYQFVLRKPDVPARAVSRTPPAPAVRANPEALPVPAASPLPVEAGDEPGAAPGLAQIDMNAPQLQQRVYESAVSLADDAELPDEFGMPIFSRGVARDEPADGAPAAVELQLQGTVWDGRARVAIINHQIAAVGDFVAGAQVVAVRPRQVDLLRAGQIVRLTTEPPGLKIEWQGVAREK